MACSKYTLTNTGTTLVNFNYRRCDDSMWEYQVELEPNQTKNIWLLNGTYSTAFQTGIALTNFGPFPAATPTPTPTVTQTPTPTETDTASRTSFDCYHDENSLDAVCYTTSMATLFATDPVFTNNTFFYGCSNGPCPGVDLHGFYLYSGDVVELDSTGNVISSTGCSATPTPTPTPSVTPTHTPTATHTPTPSHT
jgi:hypothetical protein